MKLNANQLYQYAQRYDCGNCSSPIEVHNEQSVALVCGACGTLHELAHSLVYSNQFKVLEVHQQKFPHKGTPNIKVGTKFTLRGLTYRVLGVLGKAENNNSEGWFEYYLYNAKEGYRFLTEFDGHWILLKELKTTPHPSSNPLLFHGNENYKLYSKYIAKKTLSAEGEFPIDLLTISRTTVTEYIAPPLMLTSEKHDGVETWFEGEYLPAMELYDALGGEVLLPDMYGVGVLEPQSFKVSFNEIATISFVSIALAFLMSLFLSSPQKVFSKNFDINSFSEFKTQYDSSRTYVSPSFTLTGRNQNLEFDLEADLNNNWLETEIALINDKTGNEYNFSIGVEYYTGIESNEKWTEGSLDTDYLLQKVPAGTYHLELVPSSSVSFSTDYSTFPTFKLKVTRGVSMFSGFWILLALFCIYPIVCYVREFNFEHRRWQNSEYSPYEKG